MATSKRQFKLKFIFGKQLTVKYIFSNVYSNDSDNQTNLRSSKLVYFKQTFKNVFKNKTKMLCEDFGFNTFLIKESFGLIVRSQPFFLYFGDTIEAKPSGQGIKFFDEGGFIDGSFKNGLQFGDCKQFHAFTSIYSQGKVFRQTKVGKWRKFDKVIFHFLC